MKGRLSLLIEIGCEEIPARMLGPAAADLGQIVTGLLDRAALAHGEPRLYWTPRRFAVLVPGTQAATEAKRETLLGPPARAAWADKGEPSKAAQGFARKHGLAPEQLERVKTEKGEYAAAVVERAPLGVGQVLVAGFEAAVTRMSFPKTMRWGEGTASFVRPVHWLVALAGEEVIPLTLFGVAAGRATRGHRVLSPGSLEVSAAEGWVAVLEGAGLEPDPSRRREAVRAALEQAVRGRGGELVADEGLLEEVSDMVELPSARAGSFDEKFVAELPEEVLGTCLKHHQKAFTISREGRIQPAFAVAVNMPEDPEGHIRRGHEWVISGRLEDALFFWREDRKRPLAEREGELDGVVFQRELGSYGEKARRVATLAVSLGGRLEAGEEEISLLSRAARLCRCDLVTGLVGEFPELQGQVGGLLARADGEPEEVAAAIYDLYRPAGAGDALPRTRLGRILGLADRLDTLAGGFLVGLVPSGSKDPFALRRGGTGVIRLGAALPEVDLAPALKEALVGYQQQPGADPSRDDQALLESLTGFLLERFSALAAKEGARYDEIAAVRSVARRAFRVEDLLQRLRSLRSFRESADFLALAGAAKRVRNILRQAAERGEQAEAGADPSALTAPAEKELSDALAKVREAVIGGGERRAYGEALAALARLRPVVDRFFDEVMVMDEDPRLRRARLGLLAAFDALALEIVDISELVVDEK